MQDFLKRFSVIVVSDIKDMPANNIHKMRKHLRALDSEVLCGKTSVMETSINDYIKANPKLPSHQTKENLLKFAESLHFHQVCIIFTNKDLQEITKITDTYKLEKQSKNGAISPIEVVLPAGPTGMDASQVELFANLRIPTKVVKNQLEITAPAKILKIG